MNIIIKGRSKNAPGSNRPARFHTYTGTSTEEIREIVRESADEHGATNQRMMEHNARRACVTPGGEFDCKKFEEATREIGRVMNPDNGPHIHKKK